MNHFSRMFLTLFHFTGTGLVHEDELRLFCFLSVHKPSFFYKMYYMYDAHIILSSSCSSTSTQYCCCSSKTIPEALN